MPLRTYVGGNWDQVGRLQLDFLVARGLTPTDVLLDIGCGALPGGVHLIPKEMAAFGERNGWTASYIGDWGHPLGLMMMEFVAPWPDAAPQPTMT